MADMRTIVNGWKVPKGQSGNAIRFMVQEILKSPLKALPMKQLFEDACRMAPLNQSTATWLTSPTKKNSPLNHVFERFKDENHKHFQLRLLPGAEILNGTYVDPWKKRKEEVLAIAKARGIEAGTMVDVVARNPLPPLERGKNTFALILSIIENQYTIYFDVLIHSQKYSLDIEALGEKIS